MTIRLFTFLYMLLPSPILMHLQWAKFPDKLWSLFMLSVSKEYQRNPNHHQKTLVSRVGNNPTPVLSPDQSTDRRSWTADTKKRGAIFLVNNFITVISCNGYDIEYDYVLAGMMNTFTVWSSHVLSQSPFQHHYHVSHWYIYSQWQRDVWITTWWAHSSPWLEQLCCFIMSYLRNSRWMSPYAVLQYKVWNRYSYNNKMLYTWSQCHLFVQESHLHWEMHWDSLVQSKYTSLD